MISKHYGLNAVIFFLAPSLAWAAANDEIRLPSANVNTPINTVTPAHAQETPTTPTPNLS